MLLCKRVWYQGWTPKYCPGIYYLGFLAVHAFISFVVSFALFLILCFLGILSCLEDANKLKAKAKEREEGKQIRLPDTEIVKTGNIDSPQTPTVKSSVFMRGFRLFFGTV